MDNRRAENGQTLVELGIVLPCFCLGIFMALQLILYCHNMVELQRMAESMAGRQSYDRRQNQYNLFHSLWGNTVVSPPKTSFERPATWRPSRGISTVQETGWLFQMRVSASLLSNGYFSGLLGAVTQRAFAESYLEPPVPPEE